MMTPALTVVIAASMIALAAGMVYLVWRRNPFHLAIAFLLLAVVDTLFPAIYWALFGQVDNPEWLPPLNPQQILAGVTFYSVFLLLFAGSLLAVDGGKAPRLDPKPLTRTVESRLTLVTWLLLGLTFLEIAMRVVEAGGIDAWFWAKFVFTTDSDNASGRGLLSQLPLREMFQAATGLAFFYRRQSSTPRLFGRWFPLIAIALALATFLRGSVMGCAITLIFAELIRLRVEPRVKRTSERTSHRWRFAFIAVMAIAVSMYGYGAIRDSFRGIASSIDQDASAEYRLPTFLTAGHGLLGVSHIVSEYGQSVEFLWGKTYFDMMLLPVPRSIYTSKPTWYGIDDITRGMGWPETTQSAVTMPGEAFANFGPLGLLVAIPLGALFGWLQLRIRSNKTRLVLLSPTLFFQVASVANWMSFTGIANALSLLILLFALAAYLHARPARGRQRLHKSFQLQTFNRVRYHRAR